MTEQSIKQLNRYDHARECAKMAKDGWLVSSIAYVTPAQHELGFLVVVFTRKVSIFSRIRRIFKR